MLYKVVKLENLIGFKKLRYTPTNSELLVVDTSGYIYEYGGEENPFGSKAIDKLLFPEDYDKILGEEKEFETLRTGELKDLIVPEDITYTEAITEGLNKIAKYVAKLNYDDIWRKTIGVLFVDGKVYATDKKTSLSEWKGIYLGTEREIAIDKEDFVTGIKTLGTKKILIASFGDTIIIREDKKGNCKAVIFRSNPRIEFPGLAKFIESVPPAKYKILVSKDELSKAIALFDYETELEFNNGLILRNGDIEVKIFRALLNDNEKASNYTSMPIRIHFDAKLLRNTLSCIDNKQNIFIELAGELEPIVIKSREARFWIMPMRA